ncbi:hypothetical protein [Embleya sp. NPDC005971]|uniref:hypothetical protein n=1 Tax=Embleya sp. NPDC005971 TaxID=3156724 RepID=UPI00340EEBB5
MTPDDYGALEAEATDEPAFSNSDEGYGWMDANCASCVHERPTREGRDGDGCPLILLALVGRRPRQWADGPRTPDGLYTMATQYVCAERREEAAPGETEPGTARRPIPEMAGQVALLPREACAGPVSNAVGGAS